jgi:D-arabinose 1-dehydrogenase-like Zn-dependent alcohol dehydrogenase
MTASAATIAEPALRSMDWNGRYLVVGFPAGIPSFPLNLTLLKSVSVIGVFWGAAVRATRPPTPPIWPTF